MSGLAVKKINEFITTPDIDGVKIGKVVKIDKKGAVFIDFKGNLKGPIKARITSAAADSIARWVDNTDLIVMIAFEENDIDRPVVIDTIHSRIESSPSAIVSDRQEFNKVKIDGETVTFDAKKEIVLRCGKASITLTKAGKVVIRGAYLLSRSTGANCIKGGSVQLN